VGDIRYLYGVVPAGTNLGRAPAGIDDKPVELVEAGTHGALVTTLDGHAYSPEKIELLAGNVDWLRPRAEAHDQVLNWASDTVTVIPLPMWTLFGDSVAVRKMLSDRQPEFEATFATISGAREYTVRAYVRSAELMPHLGEYSDEFAALEAEAGAALPGQRYLLERKIEKEKKTAARRVMGRVAAEVHDGLKRAAVESARDEIVPSVTASEQGHAILNGSYLISTDRLVEFRRALTEFVNKYQTSGFTFDFTGPWPPYHFVGGRAGR